MRPPSFSFSSFSLSFSSVATAPGHPTIEILRNPLQRRSFSRQTDKEWQGLLGAGRLSISDSLRYQNNFLVSVALQLEDCGANCAVSRKSQSCDDSALTEGE